VGDALNIGLNAFVTHGTRKEYEGKLFVRFFICDSFITYGCFGSVFIQIYTTMGTSVI
jgi:hypothetical protein